MSGVGFRASPAKEIACFVFVFIMLITLSAGAEPGLHSSIVHGGQLYDNWYVASREFPPAKLHPSYPRDGAQASSPKETWRCKECHGWDYAGRDGDYGKGAHATGIKGITALAGAPPQRIIAILKDPTHAYAGRMAEQDFRDLANFVAQGQVDMDRYIDRATGRAKGDPARHQDYFNSICANCHGRDGTRVRTILALGEVARKNPWEALHKILNGHPSEKMPPLRVLDRQTLIDVLAYTQTLPNGDITSSLVRGGRLYDNWRKEIGARQASYFHAEHAVNHRHPAYPINSAFATSPETNWRCKECHGWDYKGRDGAYGKGPHYTGIKGIREMAGSAPNDIIAILRDDIHGYGNLLSERDLRDVATFVAMGQVDMDRYIEPATRKAMGNVHEEQPIYTTICARCHGLDGTLIPTMRPLGARARRAPWQALHTIINGHADEFMPALRVLGIQSLVDILTYLQTMPEQRFN